jgi:hypothetical protein
MSSLAATNEDPNVIELATTLEKVRTRSNEYVATWVARMDQQKIRRKVAEWRAKQCPPPCSDKLKEVLLAEDTIA